jgi:SAM-dependent methyltransferase
MDAEALTLPDRSFDVAVSAFGFQIVTDPEKAAAQALRVLKPGGRIAVAVWAQAERCQALHTIVGPMLEFAEPDETGYIPTPYELGGPGEMVAFLEKAGFRDAREQRVVHDWRFKDEDHFFEFALQGTPLGHSLREEEPDVQQQVLQKTKENLKAWRRSAQGIAMAAEAVIVTARRP